MLTLYSASMVLEKRVGDCTEHTQLFIALARSVGIPAREVSGLAYMGDGYRCFVWHAWAEVALDGHWVQVDPTFGEPVADPTHIKLSCGQGVSWQHMIGSIAIEIP